MQLDDNLKQLMKELGNAINGALSESEDISEAIQNVRNAGYDVFLVLEATIGFNKREEGEEAGEDTEELSEPREVVTNGRVRFTTQDQRFLKALRIAVDEEA